MSFGDVDDLNLSLIDVPCVPFFGIAASSWLGRLGSFLLTEGGGKDVSSRSGVWMGSSVGALMGSIGG